MVDHQPVITQPIAQCAWPSKISLAEADGVSRSISIFTESRAFVKAT